MKSNLLNRILLSPFLSALVISSAYAAISDSAPPAATAAPQTYECLVYVGSSSGYVSGKAQSVAVQVGANDETHWKLRWCSRVPQEGAFQ